jgi:hypothetical protein
LVPSKKGPDGESEASIPLAIADALEFDRWESEAIEFAEWDVDPDNARGPTIHGLPGTGILARFSEGFDAGQIANDIGATRQSDGRCRGRP